MAPEITAAIITGICLLLTGAASVASARFSLQASRSVRAQGAELAKKFDETAKVVFLEGARASFDALTRLTMLEEDIVRVTRFSPRKIQRQPRYFGAMRARLLGQPFEGQQRGRLHKYYRLTSLNSEENQDSLIEICEDLIERRCHNLVLRVTADKNDFELIVFDQQHTAVLCFHDLSQHEVVHSCLITRDEELFQNLMKLYEKMWSEGILLEIDFSLGEDAVRGELERLRQLPIIERDPRLGRFSSLIQESELRIAACELAERRLPARPATVSPP